MATMMRGDNPRAMRFPEFYSTHLDGRYTSDGKPPPCMLTIALPRSKTADVRGAIVLNATIVYCCKSE